MHGVYGGGGGETASVQCMFSTSLLPRVLGRLVLVYGIQPRGGVLRAGPGPWHLSRHSQITLATFNATVYLFCKLEGSSSYALGQII